MLYQLALFLKPHLSVFNVFTYHTVRAGGAALTGFLFCLMAGPGLIRWLRAVKVGQYIRQEHVADLHALHKGKAGTPTMGGTLIIFATLLSLLLWGRLSNRLLWVGVAVLCMMGAVGFMDDFIKLRRKHNSGLSARAKMAGQIVTGLALGLYLLFCPVTLGPTLLRSSDIGDWPRFIERLRDASPGSLEADLLKTLPAPLRAQVTDWSDGTHVTEEYRGELTAAVNAALERKAVNLGHWEGLETDRESRKYLAKVSRGMTDRERVRLNRLWLETAFPDLVASSPRSLHTQLEVPGFKDFLIPLGPFYVLFVVFVIVAISNAVNLTDGLDGLAAGTSVISLLAYTGIAYVVSRADWSNYLWLIHVPEASELTVFGAALLGTGLGFLWYNAHPAEVFMGDTGALALGGVIGTMAILTKQELILPVVAGLFVIEALSVVIQVGSFKLTGRRVFRMAPLHHHFELLGWDETKVTIRFWIVAVLFALMSLSALKLR